MHHSLNMKRTPESPLLALLLMLLLLRLLLMLLMLMRPASPQRRRPLIMMVMMMTLLPAVHGFAWWLAAALPADCAFTAVNSSSCC